MPEVSIFQNVEEVNNPVNIELIEYLEKTRDGEWEDVVTKCRLLKGDEQKAFKKTKMPTVTLSGTFSYRSDNFLTKHSGFIAMDLDDVENIQHVKRVLEKDKYVVSVFVSTGGYGLRVIFAIVPGKHRQSFIGISDYLFENYSITCVDQNGINVSKPYIVSYDPYTYINPLFDDVQVFKKYSKEVVVKNIPDFVHTSGDFDSIIKQITGRGINICEDYQSWLKVGFAIAEQFGEDGRFYFHEVSRMSLKYNQKSCDKQYTYCLRSRGTTKANISTFYYLAKTNGINIISEQTKIIVRTTKNGKRAGLNKEQIIENLKKFSQIEGANSVVDKVFDSKDSEDYGEDESVVHQLEMFISNNYALKMNEVTGYIEHHGLALSPSQLNTVFIAAKKLIPRLDYLLMMRLLKSDFVESYNPFFKFFGSDGIPIELPATPPEEERVYESPLIDLLASTIKNNNPAFTLFFLRKWIISTISSAHKVHSPLLLALTGKQNTGKTEFFRRLLPKELVAYYAESKLDKEKDDELLMTENLIIMDDELAGKSKQESKKLNGITSKQHYYIRRPYGDHNEKILRLAVLCGTSNYRGLLTDPTGNRRIIPIEVIDINKGLYNSISKKDLFLEAFRLYKEGFDWRITGKDIPYLNQNSENYELVIKERELLLKYFRPPLEDEKDIRLSTTEILVEIENLTNQRISLYILGNELERFGFIRKTTRINLDLTPKLWCLFRVGRSGQDGSVPF